MYSTVDVVLRQAKRDEYRAGAAATFEVLPRLMGFNENVILRGIDVDNSRSVVYFYFAGEGLLEVAEGMDLTHHEGQESYEIMPPAWKKK